uniref:Epiplakin 1 n=1 Tax=Salarias fasciatus TaxID=181472 RepID=A0A672GE68_SALFA
ALQTGEITVKYGRFKGKHTTLWDLINSEYLSEDKRQELFKLFRLRKITVEQLTVTILEIIKAKEIKQQEELYLEGLRGKVSVLTLAELGIVDEKTYNDLIDGKTTSTNVMNMESVRNYLRGTNCVAGVILQPSNQKLSIYEAQRSGILTPGTALCLLEAQAATGFIVDPLRNKKFTVAQALKENMVGPQMYEKLLSAERAVTGYRDPYTGHTISLFQALEKDLIVRQHGIRLLEAQIATGGIIDPIMCIHLPVEVAYKKGYFDAELNQILSDPTDDTKGFFDPKTHENLTYSEMLSRCKDPKTGLLLLPLNTEASHELHTDEQIEFALKNKIITLNVGTFTGKDVSVWEVLLSAYISEQKREQLIQQYRTKTLTIEEIIEIITAIVTEVSSKEKKFKGLRKQVSASELYESKIISKELFSQIIQGEITPDKVTKMESVQKFLGATNCIAGVRVESTKKVMSIYEAKSKGLLTPGTSLILLEAQAATGFVIDPVNNKKLSVEEAVAQGVVGQEWKKKLLSAERAVTGYKDPYTGDTISLFQALTKDLIVKDHGIRLLEAQIATGGIIDPVHSHRVPVQVAYQRGYFDEEMNEILSDADDDTKGFFDPNTKENLTYLQLIERYLIVKDHGIRLLEAQIATGGIIDPVYS